MILALLATVKFR